jgi:CRP/FNR family transcriptional regulator
LILLRSGTWNQQEKMAGISRREFIDTFPMFNNAPEQVIEDILVRAVIRLFPAGMHIYAEGDTCPAIAFILSGEIRVYKATEEGREITLYEIGKGETCILNASCILSLSTYPANAVSTREGSMLLVPADVFRRLMETSMEIRHFVFQVMSRRLAAVMALVEEVAFRRMDIRLNEYLSEKAEHGILKSTHQKIADDLGTSREVVSRLLKDLERKGLAALSRNEITLLLP